MNSIYTINFSVSKKDTNHGARVLSASFYIYMHYGKY